MKLLFFYLIFAIFIKQYHFKSKDEWKTRVIYQIMTDRHELL